MFEQLISLNETLSRALTLHQGGRLQEAAELYKQILEADPDNTETYHLLGVLMDQAGNHELSVSLISKAIELGPVQAEYFDNLGLAYKALGNLDAALTSHKNAVELDPHSTSAFFNLALTLQTLNKWQDAIDNYLAAISLDPGFERAYVNLAMAYVQTGNLEMAIENYNKALAVNPSGVSIYCNLGIALRAKGDAKGAIECYKRAIEYDPNHAEIHKIYNNLGNALNLEGELDEAAECFQKALSMEADSADSHINLGIVEQQRGLLDEASANFQRAVELCPERPDAYLRLLCNMCYVIPDDARDSVFLEHKRFARRFAQKGDALCDPLSVLKDPNRKLRIGYLSSDFRSHPVGHNLRLLFENTNRNNFENYCYAEVTSPDWLTHLFKQHCQKWTSTMGLSDLDVAEMIRADEIDILVFLAGHFDGNRLLISAYKPAPIQISFHDIATSGIETIDYFLTDDVLHPSDTPEQFVEQLYRLPVFYNRGPLAHAPDVTEPPFLSNGHVTFGSFHSPAKITDETIDLWSAVLQKVTESRIVFKCRNWFSNTSMRLRLIEQFSARGVDKERITFLQDGTETLDYLNAYGHIDLALDTHPFAGATTTFDALWMGVPVIALAGKAFSSRYSNAILVHAGLDTLIASNEAEYVEIAASLANEKDRISHLRSSLRDRVADSPLCDGPGYALTVEAMYRDVWQKFCC
ncbi:MAG: tetratricopeptide repeat protein [Deltaproteobacteria bacterium]|nr:tetratricopeptide repeat protein [Deltaproteobacteria bacterium]